jgi:phosphatidylethanolamine/phosphatidyl-N-methylethanolamine N-methyltransferase
MGVRIMNNQWNKIIYKIWAPFYDTIFNRGPFHEARKKLFKDPVFHVGQDVLFVGVGTGADLQFIHDKGMNVTAIDFSSDMLKKAKEKFGQHISFTFLEMDAQNLQFPEEKFDVVVASLILTVVPDANRCMQEIIRVTRKNGHILIFDKFAPENKELSIGKKIIRPIISLLGTDIGLSYEKISAPYARQITEEVNSSLLFNGMYRKIKLQKF